MMGIAQQDEGVYLFKQMNDEQSVRALAQLACDYSKSGQLEIGSTLRNHLEAKLSPRSIPEIPFES